MTKDMKAVCRDFEMVTGWRIPVVERAGKAMRSMAKAEPLKKKGCERDDCFPCTTALEEAIVKGTDQDTEFPVWAA